ncbi:DUF6520 family protein [Galbibacter orientalis]|uniref:DUF6520 family protein n=1 Tax=Galbibacter orientalis TaxID=453852 RepID=UPI003080C9FB
MKTDFRKWLPIIVLGVAIGGAFTTHAMSEKAETNALVQGYLQINNSETECEESDMCLNTQTEIDCTVGGEQVFGKNEFGECTIKLYRPEQ